MLFAGIFLTELLILFFVSQILTKNISSIVYRISRSQKITIYIMALLFFPGTIIHELSHLIMAGVLFVNAGQLELWPKLEGQHVKLGSVAIAETDIFRRFLIGAAPFLFGTTLLLIMLFFAAQNNLFTNNLYIILLAYAVFEIGNTMFSSPKDMEGALELFITLIVIGVFIYFLGLRISVGTVESVFENKILTQVLQQGSLYLMIPLGIDLLILSLLKILLLKK